MKIFCDQPIKDKSEDALGRSNFAEHIAEGILRWNTQDSLCMALCGPWGSGKTSIINLCIEAIKEKTRKLTPSNRPIIVRFQPWLISGQKLLITAFLTHLRKTLEKPNLSEHARKAAEQLEKYEKLLSFISWLPKVGGPAEKVKKIIGNLRGAATTLSEQLEEDLEGSKNSICKTLSQLTSPIMIVIDDEDRLTSEEIRQLFQLIKAVADFPRTIYLLAFDPLHVEKALEPFQSGNETRYLEKIVQLNFDVPNPSHSQISAILWNGLEHIIKVIPAEETEQSRWNELRFGPLPALCRNVRDIKRYLNAVNFVFPMLENEVSTVDILIIEAIHIFAPSLYNAIRNNKEYLVSDSPQALSHSSENNKKYEWINRLPELAPDRCRDEMKEMISHLFPEIESVFERHSWGDSYLEIWGKNQRVCISSYFDYYFLGALPEGEVSSKETDEFLKLIGDRNSLTQMINIYLADGRITKLLTKVEYRLKDQIDRTAILNLIVSLFESGEKIPLRPVSMYNLPLSWSIDGTIYRLLKTLEPTSRKDMLIQAITVSKAAILFPVNMAYMIWEEWNPREGKEPPKAEGERLFTKEEVDELQTVALALIRKYKNTDILYKTPQLSLVLHAWERWGGLAEIKEWVGKILSDDKKIPEVLSGFGYFVTSRGIGSHYSRGKFKINYKTLERFYDVKQLKNRCIALLETIPSWLTEVDENLIKTFLDSFNDEDA